MSTQTVSPSKSFTAAADHPATLPTTLCSVVWSRGHAFVLERVSGRTRWLGVDDRGRPHALSCADLHRRGWTRTR